MNPSDDVAAAWNSILDPAGTIATASGSNTPSTRLRGLGTGLRSREWTAVGITEVACLREMARCLREIREGRVPK